MKMVPQGPLGNAPDQYREVGTQGIQSCHVLAEKWFPVETSAGATGLEPAQLQNGPLIRMQLGHVNHGF
jgi:hypothetical protein